MVKAGAIVKYTTRGGGIPCTYDPVKLPGIIAAVKKAKGSLGQVADLNEIARQTFYDWMFQGDSDKSNGLSTDLAQLSCKIRSEQANVVVELAENAFDDFQKARFITWWLGKICREDFADDSEEIKKFKDLILNTVIPILGGKGDNYGRQAEKELDQGCD